VGVGVRGAWVWARVWGGCGGRGGWGAVGGGGGLSVGVGVIAHKHVCSLCSCITAEVKRDNI